MLNLKPISIPRLSVPGMTLNNNLSLYVQPNTTKHQSQKFRSARNSPKKTFLVSKQQEDPYTIRNMQADRIKDESYLFEKQINQRDSVYKKQAKSVIKMINQTQNQYLKQRERFVKKDVNTNPLQKSSSSVKVIKKTNPLQKSISFVGATVTPFHNKVAKKIIQKKKQTKLISKGLGTFLKDMNLTNKQRSFSTISNQVNRNIVGSQDLLRDHIEDLKEKKMQKYQQNLVNRLANSNLSASTPVIQEAAKTIIKIDEFVRPPAKDLLAPMSLRIETRRTSFQIQRQAPDAKSQKERSDSTSPRNPQRTPISEKNKQGKDHFDSFTERANISQNKSYDSSEKRKRTHTPCKQNVYKNQRELPIITTQKIVQNPINGVSIRNNKKYSAYSMRPYPDEHIEKNMDYVDEENQRKYQTQRQDWIDVKVRVQDKVYQNLSIKTKRNLSHLTLPSIKVPPIDDRIHEEDYYDKTPRNHFNKLLLMSDNRQKYEAIKLQKKENSPRTQSRDKNRYYQWKSQLRFKNQSNLSSFTDISYKSLSRMGD